MTPAAPSPLRDAAPSRWLARLSKSRWVGPALGAVTLLVGLVVAEVALRVAGYRYTPLAFLPNATSGDARPLHMTEGVDRITVFDPELLWALRPGYRYTPESPPLVNSQGLRGSEVAPRTASERVILALGDSNTAGPRDAPGNWPDDLQHLLDLNASSGRSCRVINGGVYGYTAFQGLRRLRQLLRFEPDLVLVSFGANEGHLVRVSDDAFARRMGFLARMGGLRVLPPLTQLVFDLRDRARGKGTEVLRVPPDAYRRHLEEMVDLARAQGALVVFLTRPYLPRAVPPSHWMFHAPVYRGITEAVARAKGVPCVDVYAAFAGRPELFRDESHFNAEGYERMSELLLAELARAGVTRGERTRDSALDLGSAPDHWAELGPGWWPAETWGTSGLRGRWTREQACVELQRRDAETRIEVDLTFNHPTQPTAVEVAADGLRVAGLEAEKGRYSLHGDIPALEGRVLTVCITARPTFVPDDAEPGSGDRRTLGAFVHRIALAR